MDRAKRKANLKKLQLPSTTNSRKLRSAAGNVSSTAKISEYFTTPTKTDNCDNVEKEMEAEDMHKCVQAKETSSAPITASPMEIADAPLKSSKRTKLTKFLYTNGEEPVVDNGVADDKHVLPSKKRLTLNDFECKATQVKQAPKLKCSAKPTKKTRAKKQQTIKSAFLRNEQLFSEIAAQHCLAENFSPDEMQLALAISKSEAETNINNGVDVQQDEDDVVVDIVNGNCSTSERQAQLNESIRTKLQKYGFRTAKQEEYSRLTAAFLPGINRRKKTKWANKFTALTLRNPDYQLKKLNNNIAQIMQMYYTPKAAPATAAKNDDAMPPYKVLSNALKKLALKADAAKIICSETDEEIDANSLSKYFVEHLFPISTTKAGYLLKAWQSIQGRDLSPRQRSAKAVRREQRLQQIYFELEQYYHGATTIDASGEAESTGGKENYSVRQKEENAQIISIGSPKENIVTDQDQTAPSHQKEDSENELNAMLELINDLPKRTMLCQTQSELRVDGNCTPDFSPMKEPPDKRAKLHESPIKAAPCEAASQTIRLKATPDSSNAEKLRMSSALTAALAAAREKLCAELAAGAESSIITQQTRSTSPDLFADSDDDAVGKGSIETPNGITTFEIYSSDEVKTASANEIKLSTSATELLQDHKESPTCIVDLTQEEHSTTALADKFTAAEDESKTADRQDCNSNTEDSKNKNDEINFTLFEFNEREVDQLEKMHQTQQTKIAPTTPVQCIEIDDTDTDDESSLYDKLANESAEKSYLNFAGVKQLSSSFHKQTNKTITTTSASSEFAHILNSSFNTKAINDPVYNRLASKYLQPASMQHSIRKSLSMTQLDGVVRSDSCTGRRSIRSNRSMNMPASATQSTAALSKSASFNLTGGGKSSVNDTEESIDLTQDEALSGEDDDDEDACLLLSDDEINYSIWKANKTLLKLDKTVKSVAANDSLPKANLGSSSICQTSASADFSIPDLIDENYRACESAVQHSRRSQKKLSLQRFDTEFNLDCDDDIDGVDVYFKEPSAGALTTTKSFSTSSERADFGIMESYSEPLGLSQLDMQNVVPTSAGTDCWQDASFMQSPSEQIKIPTARKSHNFNELLTSVNEKEQDGSFSTTSLVDVYDEFDMLVYGRIKLSPTGKQAADEFTRSKTPTGFDQLLTADISYNYHDPMDEYAYLQTTDTATSQLKPTRSPRESLTAANPQKRQSIDLSAPAAATDSTPQELTVNGRVYSVRITTSCKPDFTTQTEAELLKQLYNFGIKPLKRKQAIKILEYIYNQTHPVLLEPTHDIQSTTAALPPETQTRNCNASNAAAPRTNDGGSSSAAAPAPPAANAFKLDLRDGDGAEMLKYRDELFPQLVEPHEVYIFQTNVTKKTPQPLLPLHIAWHNLVCANRTLHESIIMYETIDLQQIYLFFKSIGYRYDPKDLRTFFDSRCIIFRYDLTPGNKTNDSNNLPRAVRNPNVIKRKKRVKKIY